MKTEKFYDFRKKLLEIHEKNIRDNKREKQANEYILEGNVKIRISADASDVVKEAAKDFADFLKVSMQLSASVTTDRDASITIELAEEKKIDLEEYAVYRGFMINTDEDGIHIYGHDERGAAQAIFYIEDMMSIEKAPVLPYGTLCKKPAFSPQIVHSGYSEDIYPDEYLMRVAHEGRDAIISNIHGTDEKEYEKTNELVSRASRYGIDVYAYSEILSRMSPEDPEAESYYDNLYGQLFRKCPGIKGIVFVGESIEFPSKDPNIGGGYRKELAVDGIPCGKPSAGWYPCEDYPVWLNVVKKAIFKEKADADILFWTYNWGFYPEETRLKLINGLPTDITLLVTFEMFEPVNYGNSVGNCCDYTLSFEGPGRYFTSEAKAAKERGIRLYSMTNTGGLTWDVGVIPYQPMAQQWLRRYREMFKAKDEWNLSGIMESHHYGLYPSFISKLSKLCFFEPHENMEELLDKILISEFGKDNLIAVKDALNCYSEGVRYITPSNSDQYGAMRVGPSYPFNLSYTTELQLNPNEPRSEDDIPTVPSYWSFPRYYNVSEPNLTPLSVRIHDEIKFMEKAVCHMENGMKLLEEATDLNEKFLKLKNLCHFILNCAKTGLNAKKWHVLLCRMNAEPTREGLVKIYDEMEKLLLGEIENTKDTIPLVEKDSRLGWEPCMKYMTDRWHLEWKIRQVNFVLNSDLAEYRKYVNL